MASSGAQYLAGGGQGQLPQWLGAYLGYIAVNADPLASGRVKLRVPQVFGGTTSGWADAAVPVTYIPKVGTPVIAMFSGGDPTKPLWLGNFALPDSAAGMVFSDTEPTGPTTGEVWVNTTNGLMSEWNGAGWVAYLIGGSAIADGAELAEPNINGGVITGAQFIATGTSGDILAYSGPPATGNLIASVSAEAGTDDDGNPYLEGVSAYAYAGATPMWASSLTGGDLVFRTWSGSSWDIGPVIATDTSGDLLISAGPTGGIQVSGKTQFVNAIYTATAWTDVTSFNTGFSGSNVQYALMPQGVGGAGSIAIRGEVVLTGTTAADAPMFSLLPFTFARNHDFDPPNNLSGYSAGNRVVRVAVSGAVRCEPSGSSANFVLLDGITVPLN